MRGGKGAQQGSSDGGGVIESVEATDLRTALSPSTGGRCSENASKLSISPPTRNRWQARRARSCLCGCRLQREVSLGGPHRWGYLMRA
jgi:hypothetical protein